ncbi:hypothetical protein like AT2G44870 [Hibiscus trionum]|uniref:Uncharacterized protein n=1 Tax=Hibiscus trionum TaxID=183268 RepID=A0A9W7HUG8_HIBTR|nr:hypothetical protein like AT2G44870 [Hibiscus trionum]
MATALPSTAWHAIKLHPRPPLPQRRRPLLIQSFRRSDFDTFARRMASDRQYFVSRRLSFAVQSANDRAREIDREFEIGNRWCTFSMDFSRNWPRYRRQLTGFLDTPLGRSFATIFFLWFALSGWLFQCLILATWILPFAGPLLIGAVANNLVIKGALSSLDGRGSNSRKSEPEIIDVEFEEK